MSITVSFTSSSKRENSTKQLAMSNSYNCNYKNGCSMLNPTLLLEINSDEFPSYTAFKIENRYYNITDIRSVRNNLFEISGEVDVLATYKSNILATTAYVIYDSISNTELVDNRLPMKTSKTVSAASTPCPLSVDGGTYILSLTGSNDTTGIYKVDAGDLAGLIDDVSNIYDNFFPNSSPPDPDDYPDTITGMMKYWGDNFQYSFSRIKTAIANFFGSGSIPENIRQCLYIPFNRGTSIGPTHIHLGVFETDTYLYKLNTDTIVDTASVSIPWQVNDYRRRSPFTEIYLYLPYIGLVKLSSENLVGQSSITVKYALCLRDGSMIVTVESGNEILGQYPCNVGASVPVGVSNINMPKAAQSIISGLQSVATKNLSGIGMAGLNFGDSLTPNFSCIGGLDGIAGTATPQNITCYTVFHDTIVSPNSEIQTIGSPSMCPKSLASLTGYVQTLSASVEGAMTATERTKINNMLDSGIFIE